MNILSLFANIGVAEAHLHDIGFNTVVANELIKERAELYSRIYPNTKMICGDITDPNIFAQIINESKKYTIDIVMATPPCQGMSTAGQKIKFDERNNLTIPAIEAIKELSPNYALIENVPDYQSTTIMHNGKEVLILDIIKNELEKQYDIEIKIINTEDYSVPQNRERIILLMTKKGIMKKWTFPKKDTKKITLFEAIGHLPPIDPFIKDLPYDDFIKIFPHYEERKSKALEISKWNIPPRHVYRQVYAMQHTPTGKSAFENEDKFKPLKADGSIVKGFKNTYKRQKWDRPANTIAMSNTQISTQDSVHPGRKLENGLYSDARVFTIFELMKIMSLPDNWPLPDDTDKVMLRKTIGEGIPSLFIKKLFMGLI